MEYIRYHEMEELLKNYWDMELMIDSIQKEIEKCKEGGDIDDDIARFALKHNHMKEPQHTPGYIADRTANIAISYESKILYEKNSLIEQLLREKLLLSLVVDKIQLGFISLQPLQREILIDKYKNKLDWYAIEEKHLITKSTGCNRRREAIERLVRVTRIMRNLYLDVLKIINMK